MFDDMPKLNILFIEEYKYCQANSFLTYLIAYFLAQPVLITEDFIQIFDAKVITGNQIQEANLVKTS